MTRLTDTLIVDLRITLGTNTFITAGCVETLVLAIVLPGGAFIQIAARDSIRIQNVSFGTRTDETSLRILTSKLARWRRQFAFVDICKMKKEFL